MRIRARYTPTDVDTGCAAEGKQENCIIIQIQQYREWQADVVAITDEGRFIEDTMSHFHALDS